MGNISLLEDDIFADLDPSRMSESERVMSILRDIFDISTELIKLFVCLSSIGASVFLLYIMLKFDKLKKKISIFVLHYAVACLIDMLIVPAMNLISEISVGNAMYWHVICFFYSLSDASGILVFVFGAALGIDFFVNNFKRRWLERFPLFQMYFSIICYAVCFVKILGDVSECFLHRTLHSSHILIAIYCSLLIIITIINIISRMNSNANHSQQKTKFQLIVATYVMLSYLPLLLCTYPVYNFEIPDSMYTFFHVAAIFSALIAYSGPVVVVYLLGEKNKYFKATYDSIFKKSVRQYNEDDMNDGSDTDAAEVSRPVQNNVINEFSNENAYATII